MNQLKNIALAFLAAGWLAGCSSTPTSEGDEAAGTESAQEGGAETFGTGTGSDVSAADAAAQSAAAQADMALRETRVFYFDFDKSTIKPEGRDALIAHAGYLAANPGVRVSVAGHTDERGTREYNMALGERRAQAVERFLIVNGAAKSQIETVSYGEEYPVDPGKTESAYAQNRRAELEYK